MRILNTVHWALEVECVTDFDNENVLPLSWNKNYTTRSWTKTNDTNLVTRCLINAAWPTFDTIPLQTENNSQKLTSILTNSHSLAFFCGTLALQGSWRHLIAFDWRELAEHLATTSARFLECVLPHLCGSNCHRHCSCCRR